MSNESAGSVPELTTTAAAADNNDDSSSRRGPFSDPSDGLLVPFYEQLLRLSFPDSVTAIEHCRDLCAQFGFTVKQEASTHRNIYVYCSREGLPDSLRNPKSNPKRKRPSKRCDCRWRVVLYQQQGNWVFRKSLNPEAAKHNHELMRPEEIDRNWPKKVIDFIYELARTNLPTADIRSKVQAEFPELSWNERRFYNRLTEERQKIKHREAVTRARRLTDMWERVCVAAAGNEEMSGYIESELARLFSVTCQMTKLDPQTLHPPLIAGEEEDHQQEQQMEQQQQQQAQTDESNAIGTSSMSSSSSSLPSVLSSPGQNQESGSSVTSPSSWPPSVGATSTSAPIPFPPKRYKKPLRPAGKEPASNKQAEPPKGFATVVIPETTFYVKIHGQRVANEIQLSRNPRRNRPTPAQPQEAVEDNGPTRKTARRAPRPLQPAPLQQGQHPHSSMQSSVQQQHTEQRQQQQQQRLSMLDPQQQQHTPPTTTTATTNFVYHTGYDHQGLPLHSTIPGYDFQRFHPQQQYSISPSGSTGFAPPPSAPVATDNMSPLQPFDPSTSVVRTTNEPTIHPALQSNPVAHRPPPATIRRDSAPTMYPLASTAPGVYQLAAAAAVVTSREEEIRAAAAHHQQQSQSQPHPSPQQQQQQPPQPQQPESSERNLFMPQQHEQQQHHHHHHGIIPSYQTDHPPDTPMPGRNHHDAEPQ
ncbi:hypothetical protein BDB00DRAFT_420580 [Zychaea mexicana]|uniref:uncharacterized protein n=1 Tax=Zychaea mexicana TaxID=64656 RepID=UPI0022FEF8E6|nr:uncharacterized protein BDB00DRAFT_420580 [Zychaea mexicana]KAI9492682.1 hypothetical protein BDB00DRAFT_420580 [Zychaea mexicana]